MTDEVLFPLVEPFADGYLDLDGDHQIYWQQSGNPDGIPVVILHGGPGAGLNPRHRRFFNPKEYHIIAYDQRSAGKSKPAGEIKNNITQLLIEDLEKLKAHLEIDKWLVTGSSWGSTLSLLYAQHYPDSCLGLIVRSIFLGREFELHWAVRDIRAIFPDALEKVINFLAPEDRHDVLKAYYRLVWDPDPEVHGPAAQHYLEYFCLISTLFPNEHGCDPAFVLSEDVSPINFARIQTHYYVNHMFLHGYNILDHMDKIRHLPGIIIHGRYDMCCPIVTAFDLARQWPKAELVVVPDAGHTNYEGRFPAEIIKASNWFLNILRKNNNRAIG